MDFFDIWFARTTQSLTGWLILFSLAVILEFAASRDGNRTLRLHGLSFWLAWVPATILVDLIIQSGRDAIGITPLVILPIDFALGGWLAVVVASLIAAFGGDLIFYFIHRAQHRWFWRFHAVHHSITDLSAVNSYHHISEEAVRAVLTVAPMSFIVADTTNVLPILTAVLWFQSIYIHSTIKYNFGPLRFALLDNCFHRVHHSVEPRHFDCNYGAFTTLWDRIFGTAYMPGRNEWPETGIVEARQPASLIEWLNLPFRIKRAGPSRAASQVATEA